jgi:hypothetical protein
MQNPFLTINHTIDNVRINATNARHYFQHVFVLTKIDNLPLSLDDYINISNTRLILKKVSLDILKNNIHFKTMNIISDEHLKKFNKFNYELATNNIVITILNASYTNLEHYLNQYSINSSLENIYKTITFNNYFNTYGNDLRYLIQGITNEFFWNVDTINLHIIKKYMANRRFKFDITTIKSNDAKTALDGIDYMNSNTFYSYSNITDNMKNKQLYFIQKSNIFNKVDIINIFTHLTPYNKYLLFCYMLLTKNSYLVINNCELLELMRPIINKHINMIRYLFKYAWSLLYINESLNKTNIKTEDPYIFDIHTASLLPIFPFNHNVPKYNPYSTLLVDKKDLCINNNILGIGEHENHRGIATYEEFKSAFNLLTTGDMKTDLFEDVDFTNIGISGSSMTACIQKYHPLLDIFTGSYNDKLTKFFNEYFYNSDVDIMIKADNVNKYIDIVNKLYLQIQKNICKFNPNNAQPSHVKLILYKKCNFFVSEKFIDSIPELKGTTMVYIKENINKDIIIRNIFFNIYITQVLDKITDKTYEELFDDNVEFSITCNKVTNVDIKAIMNYKYTIKSPHLLHSLEIFQVKQDDFFSSVSTFHLPCVRAYYNGSNVFMTPSFITSQMTFMNIDYKYFVGSRDPIEIINKYRLRGYGTWLSHSEIIQYDTYTKKMPLWGEILARKYTGALVINDLFFKPRLWNENAYSDMNAIDLKERYADDNTIKPLMTHNNSNKLYINMCIRYPHSKNKFDNEINIEPSNENLVNVNTDIIPVYYNL